MQRKKRTGTAVICLAALAGLGASDASAASVTWTGATSNDFNLAGNWSTSTRPSATIDAAFSGDPATFTNGSPALTMGITTFGVLFSAGGWTIGGTNTLALEINGDGILVNGTGLSAGTDTINTPLQLGASGNGNSTYNFNVGDGNTLIVNAIAVSNASDKLSFTGNTSGVLTLQGSTTNAFTDLIANGGTINLNKTAGTALSGKLIVGGTTNAVFGVSNQLLATQAFRLGDTATIDLNGFNQTLTAVAFSTNAGATAQNGAGTVNLHGGTLTVSGVNAVSTAATTSGVTETTALIDGNANASSALALGGNATFTINAGNTAIGLNVNAIITGASGSTLTVAGAGATEFSAANTYAGTTSVTGTLVLANVSALGGGGTLDLHGGKLQNGTGSLLTVNNAVTLTNTTSAILGSTSLALAGPLTNSGGNFTLANSLSAGTLTLGGASAGTGTIYLSESATAGRTMTLSGPGSTTVNAVIANFNGTGLAGGLTIGSATASPTVTLNADNTYTGKTIINGGSLMVNGSTTSSSAVTIAAVATLGGTGTVGGTVSNAGTIAPGSGIGELKTGSATFGDNSTLAVDVGASSSADKLTVSGSIDLSSLLDTLALSSQTGAFDGSNYTIASYTGTLAGTFNTVKLDGTTITPSSFTVNGYSYSLDYGTGTNSAIQLENLVPEPIASGPLLLVGVGSILRRRKRNSVA